MARIVLSTINARYVHASLGLRYLVANLGELEREAKIVEFVLGARPADMVEALLAEQPEIVGFGVYIWNVEETTRVVAHLKQVAPHVKVVVGGPEVSYELEGQRIAALADYIITGPGEVSFAKLCPQLLAGTVSRTRPLQKVIAGEQGALEHIALPYRLYGDEDVAKRFQYVEASRGCPFKCEFCLSSLDKTAWPFPLERFLDEMDRLHARGARHFRFVDRTFNLSAKTGVAILEFFLQRVDERLSVHFEVIPDVLPEALKTLITRFPRGVLQFEAGIQTWNPEVQALISRRQDNEKSESNLRWLREHALVHADLIAGLPGEDLESFGRGFDRLAGIAPQEIQIGILKRLRGTPIARHTAAHDMRYNPDPPYNVLATGRIAFPDMQRIARFARYWELVGNSGRFPRTLPLLLGSAPFESFMRFSDWLFAETGKTHEFALDRLFELVHRHLSVRDGGSCSAASTDPASITDALINDYAGCGARGAPSFMAPAAQHPDSSPPRSDRRSARQTRQSMIH
jgi:radical SAM superfamily enzyme YgiQ (UPF0313 family)